MPEAIVRVQRQASALDRQVKDLRSNVDAVVDQLQTVSGLAEALRARNQPVMATGLETLERYRQQIVRAETMSEAQRSNLAALIDLVGQAEHPGVRGYVSRVSGMAQRAGLLTGFQVRVPEAPAGAARTADESIRASDRVSGALSRQAEEQRRLATQTRATAMSDRELQQAWRELGREERRYRDLSRWERLGLIGRREQVMLRDLEAGAANRDIDQAVIEREMRHRAAAAPGAGVGMAGARPYLQAFLGGAGFGGGGIGGLIGGTLLGSIPAGMAAAAGIGLAVGYAWQFASRGAEDYERTQRRIFETGMRLGGFESRAVLGGGLRAEALAALQGPLRLTFAEHLGAELGLATRTGRTDVGGIEALARAYGLPIEATAGLLGQIGALGILPRRRYRTERFRDLAREELIRSGQLTHMPGEDVGPTGSHLALMLGNWLAGRPTTRAGRLEEIGRLRGLLGTETSPEQRQNLLSQLQQLGAPQDVGPIFGTRQVYAGGRGIGDIIGAAYTMSSYRNLPPLGRDALMQSFIGQTAQLWQIQAAGGAPILDYERMPAALAVATRIWGHEVAPEIAGRVVGGTVGGFQQSRNQVMRAMMIRSILQLGRGMTPTQLAAFRAGTAGIVPGGLDITSYTGAIAAMQNATGLPSAQANLVLGAMTHAFRGVVGTGETGRIAMLGMFGGQAVPAIAAEKNLEAILGARLVGGPVGANLRHAIEKITEAGPERVPFLQDAAIKDLGLALGQPLKALEQAISGAVLDFANGIRNTKIEWDASGAGAPLTPEVTR